MSARVTLNGRKSLTIYHKGVEERFARGVPRVVQDQSLIAYIVGMRDMFAVEMQSHPVPTDPEPARKVAKQLPEQIVNDSSTELEETVEDHDDVDAQSARKPRKRARVSLPE